MKLKPPPKLLRKLSDEELATVVLPKLPTLYVSACSGGDCTPRVRYAERWPDGSPMVSTDGTGRMHGPRMEAFESVKEAVARYLESVSTPGCCTFGEPCDRHRAALKGRDWKTGEYF